MTKEWSESSIESLVLLLLGMREVGDVLNAAAHERCRDLCTPHLRDVLCCPLRSISVARPVARGDPVTSEKSPYQTRPFGARPSDPIVSGPWSLLPDQDPDLQ